MSESLSKGSFRARSYTALKCAWKRVMIVSDTVRALALGSIPLALAFGRLTLVQLYLVTFLEGTFFIFFGLAESACLPRIMRKEQLPAAVAATEFTYSFSTLIGPSIGGALYSIGRAFPFVADAVSYIASVIALAFMKGVGKSTIPDSLSTQHDR